MATYSHSIGGQTWRFDSLREVLAKASPLRSGDCLAGVAAARDAERLSLNQYRLGTVPYTTVVQTQTAALSAEQSLLTIRLNRLTASANLVLALGGGWRDTDLPAPYPIGGLNQTPQPPMPTPQSLAPDKPWWRFW